MTKSIIMLNLSACQIYFDTNDKRAPVIKYKEL